MNIVMLIVLYEIGFYIDENGDYFLEDFKIVYVVFMKVFAVEVTDVFSRRFVFFDIVVVEFMGDM